MDKIYIHDMEFYGYHGVFLEENKLGQRFKVDLTVELDLKRAGESDDLEHSVNYGSFSNCVEKLLKIERISL